MIARMKDLAMAEELILERCMTLGSETVSVANAAGRIPVQDVLAESTVEPYKRGDVLAPKGCVIRAATHSALMESGVRKVEVYRKPLIGYFYLNSPQSVEDSGEIRGKTNRYLLGNVLKESGFSAIYQGILADDRESVFTTIRMAAGAFDAVMICGGSETDSFLQVQNLMEASGMEILVDHVDIQPGATVCTGFTREIPVFGLAGRWDEVLIDFYLTILPVLKKLAGWEKEAHEHIMIELGNDFDEVNEVMRILPGHLHISDGVVRMFTECGETSRAVWYMQDVDACAVIPAGRGPLKKGTLLTAYRFRF